MLRRRPGGTASRRRGRIVEAFGARARGAVARMLAWLGRRGTGAIAALVVIGIAVPPLGALLRPYVAEAIFALLCISFLRVDVAALRRHLRRPALVLAATAWCTVALPSLIGFGCLAAGLPDRSPDLLVALVLQAVASPMMAAPAFAAAMGLDATLVLVVLVTTSAVTPLTAPVLAHLFAGPALVLSPLTLGAKLGAIVGGSALVAAVLRRLIGVARIERRREEIAGVNILVVFVFVAAVMESVAARFVAAPLIALALTGLAVVTFSAMLGLTALVFARAGGGRALALGFVAGQRNIGVILAATGGVLPDLAWFYFALGQLPIYLSPRLLAPLARRLAARDRTPQPGPGTDAEASRCAGKPQLREQERC